MSIIVPTNTLQNVQTYQKTDIAYMVNSFVMVNIANTKFKDFENLQANLGTTVTWELNTRYRGGNGLIVDFEETIQNVQTMSCTQAKYVSSAFTDEQLVFNVDEYLSKFGTSAIHQLGSLVEEDLELNFISGMRSGGTGAFYTDSGPYRFYGDGVTPINSFTQLAQAVADFKATGAAMGRFTGVLPQDIIPGIIGTGANNFTPKRGDDTVYNWEIGEWGDADWKTSNLTPTHIAGTIGQAGGTDAIMTVVSTNDPTGVNITQITFTEPRGASEVGAIKSGDLLYFVDNVSGFNNMRTLTRIGQSITNQPVQFRAISDATSVAGTVTVTLCADSSLGGLVSAPVAKQNLNQAIQAGMKVKVLPSHRAGILMCDRPFYLAMPKLNNKSPYTTANEMDPDSGISIRHYYGSGFGNDTNGYIRDCLYGATLIPHMSMRIILPV